MYEIKFETQGTGSITIGDHSEQFQSAMDYWDERRYEQQWEQASDRLRERKHAAFITSITNPRNSNFIRWWVCYVQNEELVFQEHILFLNELNEAFQEKSPYTHIPSYESHTEEGDPISEWRIKV